MEKVILKVLQAVRPDINFESVEGLISDEILDSFDIVWIIAELNKQCNINIEVGDITYENFDTLKDIARLVASLKS